MNGLFVSFEGVDGVGKTRKSSGCVRILRLRGVPWSLPVSREALR